MDNPTIDNSDNMLINTINEYLDACQPCLVEIMKKTFESEGFDKYLHLWRTAIQPISEHLKQNGVNDLPERLIFLNDDVPFAYICFSKDLTNLKIELKYLRLIYFQLISMNLSIEDSLELVKSYKLNDVDNKNNPVDFMSKNTKFVKLLNSFDADSNSTNYFENPSFNNIISNLLQKVQQQCDDPSSLLQPINHGKIISLCKNEFDYLSTDELKDFTNEIFSFFK